MYSGDVANFSQLCLQVKYRKLLKYARVHVADLHGILAKTSLMCNIYGWILNALWEYISLI